MNEATINTLDATENIPERQEQIELIDYSLTVNMSEEDFVSSVNSQIRDAKTYWDKLKIDDRRKINFDYWFGKQVDTDNLRDDLEDHVENDIFRNTETFLPIANSRTPELSVTAAYKNEITRKYSDDVARTLQTEWEVYQEMQPLLGRGIRNHQLNLIAVFQYGYDPDDDAFWTEEIYATDIVMSKDGSFLAKWIRDKTLGDLFEMFPNDKEKIKRKILGSVKAPETAKVLDSPVEFVEVWKDDMVGWKLDNIMLGKPQKNPHFDYEGREVVVGQEPAMNEETGQPIVDPMSGEVAMKDITKRCYYNHYKKPQKPFLFLVYWNRGIHVLDDTTLIEQGIGSQDQINKRKRQIGANADSTNGHWVTSGEFISKEEFMSIEGGVDEKIWLESGLPADGLIKLTGQNLPDYIYNDLQDSRNALDNLMGTHSTTRGESSNNNTLGQDLLQKDQDTGRIDGYVRDGIELFAKRWYEAQYHMYLVYRVEEKSIAIPEDTDAETDNVVFSRDMVPLVEMRDGSVMPVPLVLRVRQGSTLPRDEVAEFVKAEKSKDILRPRDFFKMTGQPNPRQLEKNLLMWQNDPFADYANDPDIQQMMQKKQAEAMALAQQQQAQAAAEQGQPQMGLDGQAVEPEQPVNTGDGGSTPDGVSKAIIAEMQQGSVSPEELGL